MKIYSLLPQLNHWRLKRQLKKFIQEFSLSQFNYLMKCLSQWDSIYTFHIYFINLEAIDNRWDLSTWNWRNEERGEYFSFFNPFHSSTTQTRGIYHRFAISNNILKQNAITGESGLPLTRVHNNTQCKCSTSVYNQEWCPYGISEEECDRDYLTLPNDR